MSPRNRGSVVGRRPEPRPGDIWQVGETRATPAPAAARDTSDMWTLLVLAALVGLGQQAPSGGCKNCVTLGKEERVMFRTHSDACMAQSQVDPDMLEAMLKGEQLVEDPALKKHVYCVLLKCKMISKDGKLQKAAVLGKMATRPDGRNVTKVLENCANQSGSSPEELAWNLFRCGYDKKTILFDYMPAAPARDDQL